jgi:hypothetical protein
VERPNFALITELFGCAEYDGKAAALTSDATGKMGNSAVANASLVIFGERNDKHH